MKKAVIALLAIYLQAAPHDVGWTMHGGEDNIRYSRLAQITLENVYTRPVARSSHNPASG